MMYENKILFYSLKLFGFLTTFNNLQVEGKENILIPLNIWHVAQENMQLSMMTT